MTLAPPPIEDNARCLGCGYLLRGLEAHRCPECGRGFDPGDNRSFDSGGRRLATRLLSFAPLLAFVATVIVLAPVTLLLISTWTDADAMVWFVIVTVSAALCVRAIVRRRILARYPGAPRRSERFASALIALFVLGWLLPPTARSWSCPHGSAIGLGGIGMAWSDCGGPCRNQVPLRSWRVAGDVYVWIAL